MYEESVIRELLIDSCHSSATADRFFTDRLSESDLLDVLVKIAVDNEGHLGDAPMTAAYYVSRFPRELLIPHEAELFDLLRRADGYGGSVAIALAKTRSARARTRIIQEFKGRSALDEWSFKEAMAEFDK
jgi:hypothetical protein